MDHLSPIGFKVQSQNDLIGIIEKVFEKGRYLSAGNAKYIVYSDNSGIEFWLQLDKRGEFIGGNPHFYGKSKRKVVLWSIKTNLGNEMDGAFHCWSEPPNLENAEKETFPFIFELPDFSLYKNIIIPQDVEIQLTAFAQEINYFENEKVFAETQKTGLKLATRSFISSGLFAQNEEDEKDATAIFSGVILELEKKKNKLTGQEFYWMLVDTHGGEIDVVTNIELLKQIPKVTGIIQGFFWLTGKIISQPVRKSKKGFFTKYFFKRN